jgi:CRP/FNR family cyclic AMP-dependent transcriptional regulator
MKEKKEARIEKLFSQIPNKQIAVRSRAGIYQQGKPATHVYHIQKGRVKLSVVSKQQKEAVVAILGSGDLFGEGSISGHTSHLANATAITDCVILKVNKLDIIKEIHKNRKFADYFLNYLLLRGRATEENLVDLMFNSTEKRLARALLLLADFGKDKSHQHISHPVNQDTLAAVVGSTRSRINFFMNRFKRLGFIRYNGGMQVNGSLLRVLLKD